MKFSNLTKLAFCAMLLTACSKENPIVEAPAPDKTDALELLHDSLSYTIDGNKISLTEVAGRAILNSRTNVKLDSLVKQWEYTSGDKDSVMFGREFGFTDFNKNEIKISILKKYNKNITASTSQTSLLIPFDKLDLFSPGKRKYALDFSRTNSQNGVTIEMRRDYYGLNTYGYSSLAYRPALKAELHSNSNFEITNFQKLKSGKYLLEAKFNTSVFYGDGTNIKTIENGYLRIKLNPENLYF